MSIASAALAQAWSAAGGQPTALERVTLTGNDPALPSIFAVGALAQAAIAASGLAAAEFHKVRTGHSQCVSVDMRHAAAEFRSERYVRTGTPPPPMWDAIAGLYKTADERWVRLHTNFPHHRDGVLGLLQCANTREAVAAALVKWEAVAFETAAAERMLVVTATRTPEEWAAHPQGQAVAALPVLTIEKIGEAPVERPPPAARPLSGVRVLDLTRIIAGPVAGRTLAAHGADVLGVSCPRLPSIPWADMDTGRGKRRAALDLDTPDDAARLLQLVSDADVFLQGYRPGGLAKRGFSDTTLANARPGIVVVNLSAYSHVGPWAARRGFDSLTQNVNGINWEEAKAAMPHGRDLRPRELPAQALDHAAGYVLALGAMVALARRANEGGSWRVRTSLAQMGHWLQTLPRVAEGRSAPDPSLADVSDFLETRPSSFGPLTAVRHAANLSETPPYWDRPPVPLGTDVPEWLPR
jgi:crotonobetainyl-CoA:carnitine CoA-transferase CaiB-like acyl-CoA transferase